MTRYECISLSRKMPTSGDTYVHWRAGDDRTLFELRATGSLLFMDQVITVSPWALDGAKGTYRGIGGRTHYSQHA